MRRTRLSVPQKEHQKKIPGRPQEAFEVGACGVSLWQLRQNVSVSAVGKIGNDQISDPTLTAFQHDPENQEENHENGFSYLDELPFRICKFRSHVESSVHPGRVFPSKGWYHHVGLRRQ